MKDEIIIALILTGVTIIGIAMLFLNGNTPVYP
jgi:hypothetical protein